MATKKFEFKAWGCPYVFKSEEFNKGSIVGFEAPDLCVFAKEKQVSINLMYNGSSNSCCAVLSPKKVKELIKLLKRTLE